MSGIAAVVGVVAALFIVLALLAAGLHGLRRLVGGRVASAGDADLAVLRQIALGPKQGIAVVRVCERALLVSMGDGGVRTLLELDADEALAVQAASATRPFADRLKDALAQGRMLRAARTERTRRAGRHAAVIACALALGATLPAAAQAQQASVPPVTGAPPATTAAPAAPAAQTTSAPAGAAAALANTPRIDVRLGDGSDDDVRVTGTVGAVITIGVLTLLPALLLLMTSFTRILIVLHFVRMALGTQTAPPGQLLAALALLLTAFVMAPTIERVNDVALAPFMAGEIDQGEMLRAGVDPFRSFMLAQTPESDLVKFAEMANDPAESAHEVRLTTLMSAFATSELRAAFQMGFAIFLPFIVIDLVVSAVLTGMGMFMLPPTMIALPCKLLLFVLVDGWTLTVEALIASFR